MLPASPTPEKKAGLAYWAQRVLEECDKASVGFAADPVHDLRVAIRRCRSMADGFLSVDPDPAWKQMKRLAKPLFSSLGGLRDTQVMLEWVAKLGQPGDPVADSLTAELGRKETELKVAAQESLASFDRKRWTELNAHLAKRVGKVPVDGIVFQVVALERWTDARELHRQAVKNRSGFAYHQLRIGIKRFRYTVENFLPQRHAKWSRDLRDLQDALGEVHDLDVLRSIVRGHSDIGVEDRDRWLRRIAEERQRRLDLYREKMLGKQSLWNVWRAELPEGAELDAAAMEKLRTWAAFLDPDRVHSSLVTRFALELFDVVTQCGILKLDPTCRRILEAAATLHDIGRSKLERRHDNRHQRRGFRLVCKMKPPMGWSAEQMRCIAVLVRYHRGPLPQTADTPFRGLGAKRRSELMSLIGMLRLANAFDELHDHAVSDLRVEQQNGNLTIYATGLQEFGDTAQRVARARYLLESVCRRAIAILPVGVRELHRPQRSRVRKRSAAAVR